MKISTWNVNGLRSTIRRGFEGWISENKSELICLQEVKMQEDLLTKTLFFPYNTYWNTARKRGYSGVATLVSPKLNLSSVERGIGDNVIDNEGRILLMEFGSYILINIYAPHSHRKLTRLEMKLLFFSRFLSYLREIKRRGKPIIIVGDMNIAHKEIDLANPATNKKNAGFLPEERQCMTSLIEEGYIDAFRKFCSESGHYTWWSVRKGVRERNIGWRLDYILVDIRLADRVLSCTHFPNQRGSDHCPVTVDIDI